MREKIKNFYHENLLVKGSLIVLVGSLISSFGSYLFHFSMGRLLGPANYGVLASLISISYFLGIPNNVLSLVMVKYISQENGNTGTISSFTKKVIRNIGRYGFLLLLVFLFSFLFLKNLVRIDSFLLFLLLGVWCYEAIFVVVFSSVLQGTMEFLKLSYYNIFNTWSRLIISIFLVVFGFGVGGAVGGGIIAALLTLIYGYRFSRKYVSLDLFKKERTDKKPFENIGEYLLAVCVSNFSFISFFTVDIILARHFLTPFVSGLYASLAVLGKIIFFASSPIVLVMFPMISERKSSGKNYQKLFWLSFLMTFAISFGISVIYFIFPKLMVSLLFGNEYLGAYSSLGIFAIFISLYSLCYLMTNYFLSISSTKVVYLSLPFVAIQIFFLTLFHNDINQIVFVNISTLSLLLLTLLLYYFKNAKAAEKTI